jgi:hypothetical protein
MAVARSLAFVERAWLNVYLPQKASEAALACFCKVGREPDMTDSRRNESSAVPRNSALHNRLIIQAIIGQQTYHQSVAEMPQPQQCVTAVTTLLRP